ncbi:unnamed protein product [Adineta steineri]|uniref:Uncharacterized protein n=1 Tax=Adineta steineri TaxID=433720 RepID=A0A815U380_9BILA|nr:unnamed protein product [Adineta steineri]CAF1515313.1 unnamed protein product [Adineta steineri]CAF4129278.1 unnamed protein product [Adineta steineri]CAF4183830.1 unnamed protein product [Adineta steineri]
MIQQIENYNINLLLLFMSILIIILITYLITIYYHEKQSARNIYNLSDIKTIKPYHVLYIHQKQAYFIIDQLMYEAKRTKVFTIVAKNSSFHRSYMLLHVELIQDTQTIIAIIEYSNLLDRSTVYFYMLQTFFATMFESSKTIQSWGNIIQELKPYVQYGLFSITGITQCDMSDIQHEFKLWYNQTFRHHQQCQEYLKYDDMDGSTCSCSYRPYKSSSNQWSLERAIRYTFDEQFNTHLFDMNRCLAITKLAQVIYKKWNIKQLKDYKKKYHIN